MMHQSKLLAWIVASCVLALVGAQEDCTETRQILKDIFADYDKTMPPEEIPLKATGEWWLQDVNFVDTRKNEVSLSLYVNIRWTDERFKFSQFNPCDQNISMSDASKFWKPDLNFINTRDADVMLSPIENTFVLIYSSGDIWFNQRIRITIPCDLLDFRRYPFDTLQCEALWESYKLSTKHLALNWEKPSITLLNSFIAPMFTLTNTETKTTIMQYPAGQWTELTGVFTFKRNWGSTLLYTFIPAMIAVVVAGMSFFLGRKSAVARVILAVSALFFLLFLIKQYGDHLPQVSYLKWIDIYMFVCVGFVCSALVELAIANGCSNRDAYDVTLTDRGFKQLNADEEDCPVHSSGNRVMRFCGRHCGKFDVSAGVLYLGLFAAWNVVFFFVLVLL